MTKDNNLEDYQLFYTEIPRRTEVDPLNDISTDILDEHETIDYNEFQGLSDEQVSEIARDSLRDTRVQQPTIQEEIQAQHFDSETN